MSELYDRDFSAWAIEQAQLLRDQRFCDLDAKNLIVEAECLAKGQYRLASREVRRILEKTILLHVWTDAMNSDRLDWKIEQKRGWSELESIIELSPSLRDQLPEMIAKQWPRAVAAAQYYLKWNWYDIGVYIKKE